MNYFGIAYTLLFALLSSSLIAQKIDQDQSKIQFLVSNMGLNTVPGTIGEMKGIVDFSAANLSNSRFETTVAVKTINTGNEERDEDLRTEDFFEVDTYPTIRFVSSRIQKSGSNYQVTGTLTIKDVSKVVSIPFSVAQSGNTKTFTGKLKIKRKEYNVGNSYGFFMIGSDIKIEIVCVVKS